MTGGAGRDLAFYDDSPRPVHVDLAAHSGTGWGRDTLTGIEALHGSRHGDVLAGDGGRNGLYGHGGDDRLYGRAGDDRLAGEAGRDFADGGAGRDRCSAEQRRHC